MSDYDDAVSVSRAAALMDEVKPGWHRRIVFKRLRMDDGCNCIAGQAGLDWQDMEERFQHVYPRAGIAPFASEEARNLWIVEVRARRRGA